MGVGWQQQQPPAAAYSSSSELHLAKRTIGERLGIGSHDGVATVAGELQLRRKLPSSKRETSEQQAVGVVVGRWAASAPGAAGAANKANRWRLTSMRAPSRFACSAAWRTSARFWPTSARTERNAAQVTRVSFMLADRAVRL